jgi:hypothetical protein
VQFTAGVELRQKIEQARDLLSHALPSGDLAALFERALDELITKETKRRLGAGRPRRRRSLSPGSRHVPLEVARQVWQRDGAQCAFTAPLALPRPVGSGRRPPCTRAAYCTRALRLVDEQGRRCSARRFLTIEHREPYALGGPPTVENTCLYCSAHNQQAARRVFGDAHIDAKRSQAVQERAFKALLGMGFRKQEVQSALSRLGQQQTVFELEPLLRTALELLVPRPATSVAPAAG